MKRQIYRILVSTLAFYMAAQFLPIVASTPLHYLMGRNRPQSCQFNDSPGADYFDHSAQSSNIRGFHPGYQYLDDHAYEWVIARLLCTRVWSCLPSINHSVLGELGF